MVLIKYNCFQVNLIKIVFFFLDFYMHKCKKWKNDNIFWWLNEMGCGASKATSVAPSDSNLPVPKNNKSNSTTTHVSPLSSGSMSVDEISISARASK